MLVGGRDCAQRANVPSRFVTRYFTRARARARADKRVRTPKKRRRTGHIARAIAPVTQLTLIARKTPRTEHCPVRDAMRR